MIPPLNGGPSRYGMAIFNAVPAASAITGNV
jgi:hypothetical protein